MAGPLDSQPSSGGEDPVVAIIITDPEQQLAPREKVLCRLYGFKPSEARLAVLLMRGNSLEAVARLLEISYQTAKTHLKRMLSNTHTHSQGELISLLWSGPATIRLGSDPLSFIGRVKKSQG